jgi:3',5'-cyclic-AMP phosphodiesterase
MQKVEGNVSFHTARSTAFPQPEPGKAPAPGPMKVPSEELRKFQRQLHQGQSAARHHR